MIETICMMTIALILILLALRILKTFKFIENEGIEVEGIIFGFEQSSSTGTSVSYPIVRFLNHENVWITQVNKIGTIPGVYEKGEKIKIMYKKNEPTKFYIKNKKSYMVPYTMIIIAVIILIIGTIKLILN